MVVKNIMKWLPWQALKKFQVKVRPMKLQGLSNYCFINDVVVVLQMTWNSKERPPSSKNCRNTGIVSSVEAILQKGLDVVEWTDEFEKVCSFLVRDKDEDQNYSFSPHNVSFNLLYGQKGDKNKNKLTVVGTASMNIAEVALRTKETQMETKLPISLQSDGCGAATEATLSISVSFIEIRDETPDGGFFMRKVRDLASVYRSKKKKAKKTASSVEDNNNNNNNNNNGSSSDTLDDTDESTVFDLEGSPTPSSSSGSFGSTESPSFWKKRRLSFGSSKKKNNRDPPLSIQSINPTQKTGELGSLESESCWVERELISRDGDSKIRSEVFFASIDQRSEIAAGESACTAIVAVMAEWIQSNRAAMPTKSELDGLIIKGSSEWHKLCSNEAYLARYPDKHFDLETVLEANLRPVSVMPNKSFVGFFGSERFESLKGTMSFDEIWDEISRDVEEGGEPNVYIVSWNDHFFLLKMECDACYVIDSLGERLFEGCVQAYVVKFSEKSRMYNLVDETEDLVCSGSRECCREYFKRFLAGIQLKEFEMEEQRSALLHQRLQIEFHFCRGG
ncbi:hypothetical protein Sjap_019273 [Stephania japonica]|uniref:C2 NT-type domain-containing protein n=1 Tax=Stephania japonica TaxID=461633 RepID=A0AAP0EZ48_9MAGN